MNDLERQEALRRLMVEAVQPIHPAPGSQARLQARIESAEAEAKQRPEKAKRSWRRVSPASLGWSGVGVSTAAIVVATVIFATHGTRTGSSSSGASSISAPAAASAGAAPAQGAEKKPSALVRGDLDGDGIADAFTLAGGTLTVALSGGGRQQVTLPATGPGARVLDVTQLKSPAGNPVPVVFVRLLERTGLIQDAAATLVDGRLTVLGLDSRPAVLTVDATHGYACSDGELALSGNPAAYAVQGSQLVTSPRLRAVHAVPGLATGC
jgi:hypothetical protein